MTELVSVVARSAGFVLALCTASCHLAFGDFEVSEDVTGTGGGGPSTGGSGNAPACQEGAQQCAGAALQTCTQGSWVTSQTCDQAELCVEEGEAARCVECRTGDYRCEGQTLQECNSTLDGWDLLAECAAGQVCDFDIGRCALCWHDAARCLPDGGIEKCNGPGNAWVVSDCPGGCSDDPAGEYDYCLECTEEGSTSCSPAGKVLECQGGQWTVKVDCLAWDQCVREGSNLAYCKGEG